MLVVGVHRAASLHRRKGRVPIPWRGACLDMGRGPRELRTVQARRSRVSSTAALVRSRYAIVLGIMAGFMVSGRAAQRARAEPPTENAAQSLPSGYPGTLATTMGDLGLDPQCQHDPAGTFSCHYRARTGLTTRDAPAIATYDAQTDTVYVHVPNVLTAPTDKPSTPALLQRLMELNWLMLIGKFEWNPDSGEVRLSAILNTDSNFDRRSLRSIVLALDTTLAKYRQQLVDLQGSLSSGTP